MQDCPDAKKPCKGILKTSSSFDRPGASYRKSAKFDELNVLQTLHPVDKDYGHMKIDEPKTPYNFMDPDAEPKDTLDANLLAEKLRIAANTQTPAFGAEDNLSDDEFPESDEEKVRRLEFERRRKAHYNEYEAVLLARKLMEEELEDEEEDELTVGDETTLKASTTDYSGSEEDKGGVEESAVGGAEAEEEQDLTTPSSVGTVGSDAGGPSATMDVDQPFDPTHPCAGRQH